MATTEAECRDMADAAERTGAKLMVAYRLHCEPGTREMIERVQKGEFGNPRVFTSTFAQVVKASNHRNKNGFAAGPVADMGPYPLNMVRKLFNAEPIEVMALGSKTPGSPLDSWDTVTVSLRFPQERLAHFTVSYTLPDTERFQLLGTKARSRHRHASGTAKAWRSVTGRRSTARPVSMCTRLLISSLARLRIFPAAFSMTKHLSLMAKKDGGTCGL